ncbi:hypothetical protein GOP47_0019264 [Adiantum capillus-veneris]|uniref:Pentatricopeptide repeat-containing protein n=1 Tax=Adiantum capillus-veneris TaxID=13818 RepID=A0A9D4ZAH5_ADICA|nr:hypothetical protein GOP47_0019264 [Adiantum capillus-veneris]
MAQLNERTWTARIQGHVQGERWQLALSTYQEMQDSRVHPSTFTFVALLKACAKLTDVETGKYLHAQIAQMGFDDNLHVGRMLMSMYVKCGTLPEAQIAFAKLPVKNVVSWNALIAGYSEHGPYKNALDCFDQMQLEGVSPNAVTLASVIKVCGASRAFDKGREIHTMLKQNTGELDLCVSNTFIGMYAKCGSLFEAEEVFNKMTVHDVVSWTALMTGYAEHGPVEKTLECFHQMEQDGVSPNAITLTCILKACGSIGDLKKGQEIHAYVVIEQYEHDTVVGNSLVGLYAKCGSLIEARDIFEELAVQDVVSWTVLIAGYAEHGYDQEALEAFDNMQNEHVSADAVSYACSLKACSTIGATDKGLLLHAEIAKEGFEGDLTINNTLIGMYAKINMLSEAEDLFSMLPDRNVVSWTALIGGYAEHGHGEPVLSCFEQMQIEGIFPNDVTYCCVLKACGSTGALDKGIKLHQEIVEKGLGSDSSIGTTLVGMYAKCGSLLRAQKVFEQLLFQDVTSWTAMIAGHAEYGSDHEALNWLEHMCRSHVSPNAVTYVSALKACGSIGCLIQSREIHEEATLKGLEDDDSVGNSLISVYAKCGSFVDAWAVLNKLQTLDVVAWSSMIKGYAVNEESDLAIECFQRMQREGVRPDAVTMICLLTACGHGSMVFEGQEFFNMMECSYAVAPTLEHISCMVDLLARAGFLYEAETFLEMLSPPPEATWLALLSACKTYREEEVGLRCFRQLVELNPKDATWYVIMSDIYASNCKLDDAVRIEAMRRDACAQKRPAVALMELNHKIYDFIVGTTQYPEISAGTSNLRLRLRVEGHVPDLDICRSHF